MSSHTEFLQFNTDSRFVWAWIIDRWEDYHALLDPIHVIVKFVATQLVRQLCKVDVELESRQGEVRRLKQQLINSRHVYICSQARLQLNPSREYMYIFVTRNDFDK